METLPDHKLGTDASDGIRLGVSPERVLLSFDDGVVLARDELLQRLSAAGVCAGLDSDAIDAAVASSKAGESVKDLAIATQREPQACEQNQIETLIQVGQIAFPGDVIQRLLSGSKGIDGVTVLGDMIASPEVMPEELKNGDGTERIGEELRATDYGVVKNTGGMLEVQPPLQISNDKLKATLDIHPISPAGTVISVEVIMDCLAQQGIVYGIEVDTVTAAVESASSSGVTQSRVEVANGKSARLSRPADFKFHFSINGKNPLEIIKGTLDREQMEKPTLLDLVRGGDCLCEERSARPSEAGIEVFDEEIKAASTSVTKITAPNCGSNVVKLEGKYLVEDLPYGYADIRKGVIQVLSPLTLDNESMEAEIYLYPQGADRRQLDKQTIDKLLTLHEVSYGIDVDAIERALAELKEPGCRRVRAVIARGQFESVGEDARFGFIVPVEKLAGEKKTDGSIDFRERGTIINLSAGDAIGRKLPPTVGKPRVNVLGETTPAKSGEDFDFEAGENCELRNDGIFYATAEGALLLDKNTVRVVDVYKHKGDVDLNSGNLLKKKGAIDISGSLFSGFKVRADGHVLVKQNAENGRIVAGGDVAVGGGVIQPPDGIGVILSRGSVSVKYAQNANIVAGNGINIGSSAMNSRLLAKGTIYATTGKGCIIGGVARSSSRIHAKQLGSEAGALTRIEIGIDKRQRRCLKRKIARERKCISLNQGAPQLLQELLAEKKQLYRDTLNSAAIIVEGTLYPGTTIKILKAKRVIKNEKKRCIITLKRNNKLCFENL